MKNFKTIILIMITLAGAPLTSHGQAGSAAGGMSVGTAVAIGVVGAALLVALGDSSSSAPAAVSSSTTVGKLQHHLLQLRQLIQQQQRQRQRLCN